MKEIDLYTDGACSGNPGAGGWGAVLLYGKNKKELSGYDKNTTNNRMEITAVIEGLKAIKEKCSVTIYTDSAYVHNAFTMGWIDNWQKNGWRNSKKDEVLNKDLWLELISLVSTHEVKWVKVKGHADNVYNNVCDRLATGEISKNNI